MSNRVYRTLKFFTMFTLPFCTALSLVLSARWGGSNNYAALGLAIINAVLGAFVLLNSQKVTDDDYDGELALTGNDPDTGIPGIRLTITADPNDFAKQKAVVLKSVDRR